MSRFDFAWWASLASIIGLILSIISLLPTLFGTQITANLPIITLFMCIGSIVGVMFWLSFSLNRENNLLRSQLEVERNERTELKEKSEMLQSHSCIFVENCQGYPVLSPLLGKDNGYFSNADDVNNCIQNCKNCKSFPTNMEVTHDPLSTLESEVRQALDKKNQQDFRVFIDFCKETMEFANEMQAHLEYNHVHCTQLLNCQKISELVDKRTIVIIFYCDVTQNSRQKPPLEWLYSRFRAYNQSISKIDGKKKRKGSDYSLEVWLCCNPHFVSKNNIKIPEFVKVKDSMEKCEPKLCCTPEDISNNFKATSK